MYKRQQRLARRTYRFERLELRAMLASDVIGNHLSPANNSNWDLLAGDYSPAINAAPFYSVDDQSIELKVSSNKLVIGFDGTPPLLPEHLKQDFGLANIATVFETTRTVTPDLIASIESIPGVSYTAPVFVTSDTSSELALLDEFIVQLNPGTSPDSFFATLPEVASYRRLEGSTDQYIGQFSNFMGRKALDRTNLLQGNPLVAWVEPNFYQNWQRNFIPNDPRFANQWHLNNTGGTNGLADADVDMPEAWDINQGGSSSIVIAIVDDGVQAAHPDLNVWTNPGEIAGDGIDNDGNGWIDDIRGWNFVLGNNQTEPLGTDKHGTSVAGVAAARGNNGIGVAGAAYNSQVISIKMFDGSSVASTANIAAALRYAAGIKASGTGTWDGADIVNNSWGGGASSATINNALISGTTIGRNGLGATYLFASGNDFAAAVSQPAAQSANIAGVIAVGATNNLGTRSNYSNYGTALDFVAPSNDTRAGYLAIDTTDRTSTNGYASGDYTGTGSTGFGGTSSATPLSAGIAALALAQADVRGVTISPSNLRGLMRNNTDLIAGATYNINTGKQSEYGFGRINAASLLAGIGNAEISVVNATSELLSGTSIALGNLAVGQSIDTTLRIRNQGTQPLVISSISVPAPFSLVNFSAATLPVGGTMNFVVRFSPTSTGSFAEDLIISNNDANEAAFTLRLSASALGPRILGRVFEDFNNNASPDSFERGVTNSGFVYIDANNNSIYDTGEQQTSLDATGNYFFAVPNGTYRIRAELPGWTRTTSSSSYLVNLTTNDDISVGNDFGFAKNNRFYAFVYEDTNRDGIFNGSDTPRKDFVVNAGKASFSNSAPVPIPDLAMVLSPITVPSTGPGVGDLDVKINVAHTYTGDLEIALLGPDGTTINLADNRGGAGDNFTNTVFDDAATASISTASAPFTGRFRPDQALSTFNGKLSPGVWQLRVIDQFSLDVGTILGWQLDFNSGHIATSDINGWALMDLGTTPVTAKLELQTNWQYSQPSNGEHALTPNGTPIFGRAFGIRAASAPPSDIALSANTLPENAGSNALIGTLSTIDPDAGDSFSYTLVAGTGDADNAAFNIDGNTLRANSSFDFETKSSYTLRIRSTDASGLSIEKSFVINITDVHEAPSDIALSANTLPENAGSNAIIGTLSTTDPDAGDSFSYTLVAGTGDADNAAFNIDGNTLHANSSFDFETKGSYTLRIRSTDSGGLSVEKSFVINITDVHEAPSDIALSANTLPENAGSNALIGTLSTTDPDAGDSFSYTLVAGTGDADNAAFNIDGNTLHANSSFDFETKNSYTLRVRSTDASGLFIEKSYVIQVEDLPENVTIPGTAGNDSFVASYTGDGITHSWIVTRGNITVFNGSIPLGTSLSIDGLAGSDSLQIKGLATNDLFVLESNRITLNGAFVQFPAVETLRATGELGNDTLRIEEMPTPGTSFSFDGGAGTDWIESNTIGNTNSNGNTWNITGAGIGNLDGTLSFTTVESLQGSAGDDQFLFGVNGRVTGQVLGGQGIDTLNLSAKTTAHTINLQSNTATSTGGIGSIENFIGGSSPSVIDVLVGANSATLWTINATNAGQLTSTQTGTVTFQNFDSLTGGTAVDTFTFTDSGSLSRAITGGTATGVIDIIDLSAKSSPLDIQLNTTSGVLSTIGSYSGIEQINGNGLADTKIQRINNVTTTWAFNASGQITVSGVTYNSVGSIVGGPGVDSLTGPSISNGISTWTLNGAGSGVLAIPGSNLSFSSINNITGGTGADAFEFLPSASLSGNLNAGAGTGLNSISYAQWSTAVNVNLALTTASNATAIAGILSNIQMLIGGSNNDTLTGNGTKSTILVGLNGTDNLTGGSKRDILIGGLGTDGILGAAGDDILISGTTQFDTDRSSLFNIYSEWISSRTFAQRTANIWGNGTGIRSNGTTFFNSNPTDAITDTVFADEDIDTLTGGLNQDWFFASLADTIDLNSGSLPDRLDR